MKVEVRRLINDKWILLNFNDVVGKTLLQYCLDSEEPIVCYMFKDSDIKKPYAFVSNRQKYVDIYDERGWSVSCEEMKLLMGTPIDDPALVVKTFPNSNLVEISTGE
jgi:hypothetical protein